MAESPVSGPQQQNLEGEETEITELRDRRQDAVPLKTGKLSLEDEPYSGATLQ